MQQDLDRITEVAERVHRLATHAVAHRLSVELDESARSVTRADVAQLVEDLNDICGRWTHLLRNVTLSEPADSPLSAAILKALELFDFDAFAEAVAEEIRRLGPSAGSYRDVEARARIEYRFDEGSGDYAVFDAAAPAPHPRRCMRRRRTRQLRPVGHQLSPPADPPTRRAVWRFHDGPERLLLCDLHAAELAGHDRLGMVEPTGG